MGNTIADMAAGLDMRFVVEVSDILREDGLDDSPFTREMIGAGVDYVCGLDRPADDETMASLRGLIMANVFDSALWDELDTDEEAIFRRASHAIATAIVDRVGIELDA